MARLTECLALIVRPKRVSKFEQIQYLQNQTLQKLERIKQQMQNDKAALDAKLTELGEAIGGVADRVSDLLTRLAAAAPGFAEEIDTVQTDIDKLKTIAAPAADTSSASTTNDSTTETTSAAETQVTS